MDSYPDFPFGGSATPKELMELSKAISTGQTYGTTDQTGGAAVRLESLQNTLKSATFQANHAKMWQMIPKKTAGSTIEEYAKLLEVGDAQFYAEGGLPEEIDSVLGRNFEIMKYLGAVGKVSNPALAVRNLTDLLAMEKMNRTNGIIRKLNQTLYFGNATMNTYEFPGLQYQVTTNASTNVVDMLGKRLRLDDINDAAQMILDNYGIPSHLFLSPAAKSTHFKELTATKTWYVNQPWQNSVGGGNQNNWITPNGEGQFVQDVFLRTTDPDPIYINQAGTTIKSYGQPPSAATSLKAPATPVAGSSATSPTDSTAGFLSGDAATYDYKITARNQYGESAALSVSSVTVTAGDNVTIPVVEGAGAYTATAYKVYRKLSTEDTYYFCFQVAYSDATQSIIDRNSYRHNTTTAFMIDMNSDQVLAYHQLLPFFSMPLAVVDDSIRFLMKLYGGLIVYNPKKVVMIKNIGTTAHS